MYPIREETNMMEAFPLFSMCGIASLAKKNEDFTLTLKILSQTASVH
jgi:hypothetical protein